MAAKQKKDLQVYLEPTGFIDSQSTIVVKFAKEVTQGVNSAIDKAVKLYYAVRDGISYDPYRAKTNPVGLRASTILKRKVGNCISKAILLAAAARAEGIPSRLGFADVRNHLATDGLRRILKSDVFRYHGYTELFLNNRWVKVTPTFNRSLVCYFDVKPLEFDGENDSMFQEFNKAGGQFMEYLKDHGQFADLPYALISKTYKKYYPHLTSTTSLFASKGSFVQEAVAEHQSGWMMEQETLSQC